ncbi:hypothetical protein O9G_000362 [Rozella allomycis CSF55]|uniref:Uncharacterized protein n=1 Tax=Rozella allomycis (strain CSF55) TaxID=988480 RepID=A0A075AY29_ROZAC|nr:hypothetical protein O9G_000362 [Rozella allomycis CSF55]|eukprot:EPZ33587.1 hypothetical protein O9G_000362 [Rozella allomycis CSF55]
MYVVESLLFSNRIEINFKELEDSKDYKEIDVDELDEESHLTAIIQSFTFIKRISEWDYFPQDIIRANDLGVTLLGGALGDGRLALDILHKRIDQVKEILKQLQLLESSQIQLLLLRSCIGLPKISYFMRTRNPSTVLSGYERFDGLLRNTLEIIGGGVLLDRAWLQASLPIKEGGLGILSAVTCANPVFIASIVQTAKLCSQESFLAIVTESGEPFDYDVLSEVPKPQHFLTQCIHTSTIVTESGEPFDYDVLSEVPKPQHFLTQCIHTSSDPDIVCASAKRVERHNDIVRVSAAAGRDVGARVDLEPSRLFPDDKKRPDFTIAAGVVNLLLLM